MTKFLLRKRFLLLKYQKLLIFLVKNLKKKLSYFSRCFYMESSLFYKNSPYDRPLLLKVKLNGSKLHRVREWLPKIFKIIDYFK